MGDKRTCALIDKLGTVVWYFPWRFDQPSLFSLLIDEEGGFWSIEAEGKTFAHRHCKGESAILISEFTINEGAFFVTDFMPMVSEINGLCTIFSPAPVPIKSRLFLKPDYRRSSAVLE
jgi:GH15 family glucan-1,4-alpha-glucosidase